MVRFFPLDYSRVFRRGQRRQAVVLAWAQMKWHFVAFTTAEILLVTPSLWIAFFKWKCTVRELRLRMSPISVAVLPFAVQLKTSVSRDDK